MHIFFSHCIIRSNIERASTGARPTHPVHGRIFMSNEVKLENWMQKKRVNKKSSTKHSTWNDVEVGKRKKRAGKKFNALVLCQSRIFRVFHASLLPLSTRFSRELESHSTTLALTCCFILSSAVFMHFCRTQNTLSLVRVEYSTSWQNWWWSFQLCSLQAAESAISSIGWASAEAWGGRARGNDAPTAAAASNVI